MKIFNGIAAMLVFCTLHPATRKTTKSKTTRPVTRRTSRTTKRAPIKKSRLPQKQTLTPVRAPETTEFPRQFYKVILDQLRLRSMGIDIIDQNNQLTPLFIKLIKDTDLSTTEKKALLEAGANLYIQWTGNPEQDKATALALEAQIGSQIIPSSLPYQEESFQEKPLPTEVMIGNEIIALWKGTPIEDKINKAYDPQFANASNITMNNLINESKIVAEVFKKYGNNGTAKRLLIQQLKDNFGEHVANGQSIEEIINTLWNFYIQ